MTFIENLIRIKANRLLIVDTSNSHKSKGKFHLKIGYEKEATILEFW